MAPSRHPTLVVGLVQAYRARYRAVTRRGPSVGRGLASPTNGAPMATEAQVISFPPFGLVVLETRGGGGGCRTPPVLPS